MKIFLTLFLWFISAGLTYADETIYGNYCYTYGDDKSLIQARNETKKLAIRNAIESYRVFVESTSKVEDSILTEDIVSSISTGLLSNITSLKHTEEGNKICDTIKATVIPEDVDTAIQKALIDEKNKTEEEKEQVKKNKKNKVDQINLTMESFCKKEITKYNKVFKELTRSAQTCKEGKNIGFGSGQKEYMDCVYDTQDLFFKAEEDVNDCESRFNAKKRELEIQLIELGG